MLSACFNSLFAQSCDMPFIRTIGSGGTSEKAYKIIPAPDGNLLVGGNKGNAALLMKVTPDGEILWERTFDFNFGADFIYDMIIDSEGKLVVVGRDQLNTTTLCFIMRYDLETNAVLWSKKLPDPAYTRLEGVLELPNQNYFIYGMTNHGGNLDNLVMEVNKNDGALIWQKSYNNGQTDVFFDAVLKGNFFYTANVQRYGGLEKMRAAVSKLALNGNQLWTRNYVKDQGATARMYADAIEIANDTLVVFGHGNLIGSDDVNYSLQLFTTNLDGDVHWAKQYTLPGNTSIGGIVIPVSDGYILQGIYTKSSRTEMFMVKVNKQGTKLWAKSIGGPENETSRSAVYHNGYIYFVGHTNELDANQDIFFGKMTLDGEVLGAACAFVEDIQVTTSNLANPYDGQHDMLTVTGTHALAAIGTSPLAVASPIIDIPGCGCQTPSNCTNLLLNPSFENSLAGWSVTGSATASTNAHSGSTAAAICGSAPGSISQIYPAIAGEVYTASLWALSFNPPSNAFAQLRFLNASYTPISSGSDQQYILSTDYELYNLNAVAPSGTAYVHFMIWKQGNECVIFDDVRLCKDGAGPGNGSPDLTVSNIAIPIINTYTLQAGSTMPVTFNLSNNGTGPAQGSFDINIYVSGTAALTQNSILVKTLAQQTVAAGAAITLSSNPVLPTNLALGSYHVIVTVDAANTIAESNENNNTTAMTQPFTVYGSCAMLATVSSAVCNNNGTPNLVTDDYFNFSVSAINTIESSGYYLNTTPPNQTNGISYGATFDVTQLPITAGNVSLVLTDAINPSCIKTFTVTAPQPCSVAFGDLVPSNLDVASTMQVNNTYYFSFRVKNIGTVPISGTSGVNHSLYLSTDNQFNNSDLLLAGDVFFNDYPVNANQPYGLIGFGVPNVQAGNYYLILVVDKNSAVQESNEANNWLVVPVTVQSAPPSGNIDLSLTVTSPATAPIYTSYPVAIKVTNSGSLPATGVKVVCQKPNGVVYTGGNEFTASQGTFGPLTSQEWVVGTLAPGATATLTVNYFLLQNTLPTVYAQVTAANENDPDSTPNNGTPPIPNEDDEASNAGAPPPPPTLPDFVPSNLTIQTNTGGSLSFSYSLNNLGAAITTGGIRIQSWFSIDQILSANDIQGSSTLQSLASIGSYPFAISSVSGYSLAPGNYFLIIKVDDPNLINEANENNNTMVAPFIVAPTGPSLPDLAVYDLQIVTATLPVGSTEVIFNMGYSNIGNAAVNNSFTFNFYVSTDALLSADDLLQESLNFNSFGIGQSSQVNLGISPLPGNLPPGTYYLIPKMDAGNAITESNEANNVVAQPFTIVGSTGQPDCNAISIAQAPGQITITGHSAPHVLIKVFRPNWTVAFECLDGNCSSPQIVNGLASGNHHVEVKLMNASWGEICTKTQTVGVTSIVAQEEDRFRLNFDKFYPNPTAYLTTMELYSPVEQRATLDFYDRMGRLVHSQKVELEQGQNLIEQFVFDWKSGTYNVIARGEETALPAYGRLLKVWEE
jgi:subtilase family serine protease